MPAVSSRAVCSLPRVVSATSHEPLLDSQLDQTWDENRTTYAGILASSLIGAACLGPPGLLVGAAASAACYAGGTAGDSVGNPSASADLIAKPQAEQQICSTLFPQPQNETKDDCVSSRIFFLRLCTSHNFPRQPTSDANVFHTCSSQSSFVSFCG